jgi:hypothetical protein
VIRLSRSLVIGACMVGTTLAGACSDETTAPGADLVEISHDAPAKPLAVDLTRCTPQPAAAASARIGPNGGTVRAGKHMLRVPAGALKRSVLITMEAPSDSLDYVVFGPEGLTFDPDYQPTLVLSYRHCAVKDRTELSLDIIYTDDAMTTVLDTTESVPADTLNHTVSARLKHFSRYVLRASRYAVAF